MIVAMNQRAKLLELLMLSLAASIYAVLSGTGAIDISTQIYVTTAWLVTLLYLSWKHSDGGMHPIFFFLTLLLLFQGGRLIAYCLHVSDLDPLRIELGGTFDVGIAAQRTSLFMLMLSSLAVYAPFRLFGGRVRYERPETRDLVPYLLILFLVTLPFHAWKNYEYFSYVRSHGGYLAIFQSSEHLEQAGLVARSLSQLCTAAFIAYFCFERPRLRLALITLAYLTVSVIELLIGLRGKVLLFGLCLFFLWKLKRGTRFRLRSLALTAIALAVIGQSIAMFREERVQSVEVLDVPAAFLASQGGSFDVTETMVAYRSAFIRNRGSYLRHFLRPREQSQLEATRGLSMEDDIGIFLDPLGFSLGYGTGGSFLAEGFLYGGAAGVVIESCLVGFILLLLARGFHGGVTPYAWTFMLSLLYLPRANLLPAVAGGVISLLSMALVMLLANLCLFLVPYYRSRATA